MNLSNKIKKLIEKDGLVKTSNLFGGIKHLKKFLSNDPEFEVISNNLNGKVYYPFLENTYEFNFEIIDYKLNKWETQGTALINVIYDYKKLNPIENEKLKSFIVINNDEVDYSFELNPKIFSFFPRTFLVEVIEINGEDFDPNKIIIRGYKFYESEIQKILYKINSKNNKDIVNENKNPKLKNFLLNIIETQGLDMAIMYVDGIQNLSNIVNIPLEDLIADYFQQGLEFNIEDFDIDTGGYEFIFKLLYVENNDNHLLFFYEIVEGTVTLMMTDETLDLKSIEFRESDFAWEIKYEINDLLSEFTFNLLRNLKLTGFEDVLIDYTI